MPLTQLECFRSTLSHESHEGILAGAQFTPDLAGRLRQHLGIGAEEQIASHLGLYEPASIAPVRAAAVPDADYSHYYEGIDLPEGSHFTEWGVLRTPVGFYHFEKLISPLREATTLEGIKDYPYPLCEDYDESELAAQVDAAHRAGRVAKGAIGHIFETSWQIRGMEQFFMDMLVAPENCDYILDRVYEHQKAKTLAVVRAGVDYIHTGDDVAMQKGMMFSVERWRRFIKPRWADIYRCAKQINPHVKVWYHSDGDISAIIPELIEIGVDILNPIQPECIDPSIVAERWGADIVLDGCIGTQSVMPFGTPDDVRATVHRLVDTVGGSGALILGPTHTLEPEVPIENVLAYVEAAREYGEIT